MDPETSSGWHNLFFIHAEFTSASFNIIGFHTIQNWWVATAFEGSWNKFRMTLFAVQSCWIYFSIFQYYWLSHDTDLMGCYCLWGILKQVQDDIIYFFGMLNLLQHLSVLLPPHGPDFMGCFYLWEILKQVQDDIIRCSVMLNLLQHRSVLLTPNDPDFMSWFCLLGILKQVQDDIFRCSVMLNLPQHLSVLLTPYDPDFMDWFCFWEILKQVQDGWAY